MSTTNNTGTSNTEMGKKIIIGAVSTIIAALVIYFVVERGGGDRERKKATLNAWNSYEQNKDIFQKVMTDLGTSLQQGGQELSQAKANAARDIDITIENMQNIKTEEKVDNRMLSLVDVKITQLKDLKTIMMNTIQSLEGVMQSTVTEQEAEQYVMSVFQETKSKLEGIKERDRVRIKSFRDELCKEYGSSFCQD
jgi:hypothetical protein